MGNITKYVIFITMIKISDVIKDIVTGNPFLQFGIQHKLLNLSQVTKYLRPIVAAKSKKEVTDSALLMAISRLQGEISNKDLQRDKFSLENISIHTGLATFTYVKTEASLRGAYKLHTTVHNANGYITISEGTNQITIIVDAKYSSLIKKLIRQKPQFAHENVSSVGITFSEEYIRVPGMIYMIIQQLMLMNINILEVSSTYTELAIYMANEDIKPAFEVLHSIFVED